VGAQTDLIFDGASMCFNEKGELVHLGKTYAEDFIVFDTDKNNGPILEFEKSFEEEAFNAIVFGLREYMWKTGFKEVVLGLSGGIDSAVVAAIATEAVGKENVHAIMLPSKISSKGSVEDAKKLIDNLGIKSGLLSIAESVAAIEKTLEPFFAGTRPGVAEENVQARTRGLLLMALANKFNWLLLATGNKSELSVGYATLYGDMNGALEVIGDVYKTEVYKIAEYINREKEIIPREIITKPPSAELKPGQVDQDTLPPYDKLDAVLHKYLEEYKEYEEIVAELGEPELVAKILRMVDLNEYKRFQSAPVLRVSTKAFGYGRRFPIVQGWRK
jgi:NAD+ synthase (glutamine-hydrolysing)